MTTLFSIIICSYNPDLRLLERCINAALNQKTDGFDYEIILVDNNSKEKLKNIQFVQDALKRKNGVLRVVEEVTPGLAFARIKGVQESKGSYVVFADDDNELSFHYLITLKYLWDNYSFVGAWGAGAIEVDFIDNAPLWLRKHFKDMFQYRKQKYVQYGCIVGWPEYYPVGSGMAVRKDVFEMYRRNFESGKITAIDRKAGTLSSAGDSQIVWTAILNKIPAGSSPDLALTHIIPFKRTHLKYLTDLNYNISKSYYTALFEMFPEEKNNHIPYNIFSGVGFAVKQMVKAGGNPFLFYKFFKVRNAWNRGLRASLIQ
ncbi:glycosyltransferase family A protein [Sporocytophaga myxococcoides]|uniref:glycosyltransferase family A protein n=1 Tax=Sporocytophaga myxococcoides TaxID=153721 RepID=UPI00048E98A4|nr:glycosyltransferase family A protein [Sporocytophaga myxococcoides]